MNHPTYLTPGTVLQDRYEIGGELGRGGYSVVYRARDRRVGGEVAVKLLVAPPAAAALARERLRREVHAVRRLSHPNIVAVYDVADEGPWSFVVMELVAGPDLAVRVRGRGPLDPATAARLGRELAEALGAAHRCGILHRDVKPQNILLAPDGHARLADFGSARLAGLATVTQTGGLVGTLAYAAPEVVAGARADARADCYGLGLTLYFALTGELPPRVAAGGPVSGQPDGHHPRARRADIPPWLDAVVARATTRDPGDRFPTAGLLAAALSGEAERESKLEPWVPVPTRGTCVICRAAEPFGVGVCPRCTRRASGGSDVLVFVERTSPGPATTALREVLADRIGAGTTAADRDAAVSGERPLFRVPAEAGARVVEQLDRHGIPARLEALRPAWRTDVHPRIAALAGVVVTGGIVAAEVAGAAALLAASPFVAATLAGVAAWGRRVPVWDPRPVVPQSLPAEAERAAVQALAVLPDGPARRLLADLLGRASGLPADASVRDLIAAACAAARELAVLERHLDAFDAQAEALAAPRAWWADALARCERARDALVQRLLDATAVLSGLTGRAALRTAAPDAPLASLARELDEESRVQAEAAREVELLLGAGST